MKGAASLTIAVAALLSQLAAVHSWAGLPEAGGGKAKSAPGEASADSALLPPSASSSPDAAPSSSRRVLFKAGGAVATAAAASVLVSSPVYAASGPYVPPPHSVDGKVVVITGGNTGLGLESGKRLAAAGAEVILTARSEAKGQRAVQSVSQYLAERGIDNDKVFALPLDLCDMDSVKAFPNLLEKRMGKKPVDVLMNNAGVMAIQSKEITKDGFERTFQTNHLGHFVLTAKIAPQLANDARIINVSSEAWQFASKGLELDNLNGEREYGPWSSYGQSKLANILFTTELQERSKAAGKSWTVTSLHPGAVATDLGRYLVGEEKWNSMKENGMSLKDKILFVPLSKFTKTVEDGASTQIYLAADGSAGNEVGGKYFIDSKAQNLKGASADSQMAEKLWMISEQLSGVQFNP